MKIKYKHFKNTSAAQAWVNQYSSYFPQKTNTDKNFLDALYYYTASANVPINRHLRNSNDSLDKTDFCYPFIQMLINGLSLYQIPENIIVYRFTNSLILDGMCSHRRPHKGMIMHDKGFMSTTLLYHGVDNYKENRHSNIMLKISIPAGTKGTYVGLTDTLSEYEILLNANTKLRIDSFVYPFCRKYSCTVINS